ncbi:hypothetical protein FQZ97_961260 [compost metagenome]
MADEPAVLYSQQGIGGIEVTVVMGNHHDGLAETLQVRQQLGIEDAAERRVLVRRPLVEHQHWTLLGPGLQ